MHRWRERLLMMVCQVIVQTSSLPVHPFHRRDVFLSPLGLALCLGLVSQRASWHSPAPGGEAWPQDSVWPNMLTKVIWAGARHVLAWLSLAPGLLPSPRAHTQLSPLLARLKDAWN